MSAHPKSSHPETYAILTGVELIQGLGSKEVLQCLLLGTRLREAGFRILAFYLAEMVVRGLHSALGYSSTAHFALTRLGLDRRRCSELVVIGKKLLELPLVDAAFLEGSLAWSKVVELVRIVTPENQEAWLEHAKSRTVRDLADDVRRVRRGELPRHENDGRGTPHTRFDVTARVGKDTYDKLEAVRDRLQQKLGRPVTTAEVLDELLRVCPLDTTPPTSVEVHDEEHDEDTTEDGRTDELDPQTSKALRDEVLALDGFRCQCCGRTHGLHVHHVIYRSEGGPTVVSNLTAVCRLCHGLIHDDYLVCTGTARGWFSLLRSKRTLPRRRPGRHAARARISPTQEGARPSAPPPRSPPPRPGRAEGDRRPHEWWRRHAALIRFHQGGVIELVAGQPLSPDEVEDEVEDAPEEKPAPMPVEEAFRDLVIEGRLLDLFDTAASSARLNGKAFPHTFLSGPPGTGKTSLAEAIARLVGATIRTLVGVNLQDLHTVIRTLAMLRPGDVLFVDEVHGAKTPVMDLLLGALQKGEITLSVRVGALAREVTLKLPPFTMVAATTEEQRLTPPFQDRFGIRETRGRYELYQLVDVVLAIARRLGIEIDEQAAAAANAGAWPRSPGGRRAWPGSSWRGPTTWRPLPGAPGSSPSTRPGRSCRPATTTRASARPSGATWTCWRRRRAWPRSPWRGSRRTSASPPRRSSRRSSRGSSSGVWW